MLKALSKGTIFGLLCLPPLPATVAGEAPEHEDMTEVVHGKYFGISTTMLSHKVTEETDPSAFAATIPEGGVLSLIVGHEKMPPEFYIVPKSDAEQFLKVLVTFHKNRPFKDSGMPHNTVRRLLSQENPYLYRIPPREFSVIHAACREENIILVFAAHAPFAPPHLSSETTEVKQRWLSEWSDAWADPTSAWNKYSKVLEASFETQQAELENDKLLSPKNMSAAFGSAMIGLIAVAWIWNRKQSALQN